TVGVTCLTRDGAVLFRGPQGQRCRSLCSAPMRVRRGWEGRAMSTTDSVAGGSPGPWTPGAGASADMSPQAGPRAAGAVPGAAAGRGRKSLRDREKGDRPMGVPCIPPAVDGGTGIAVYPLVYCFGHTLAD